MNKKIIALALAMVFIASAFTACKKELETMKIAGAEYPIYRDDKGELVINEKNEIAVLVTDRQNNEIVTYEDGEPQTYWLQMDKDTVNGDQVQGKNYTLNIPSGWEGSEFGRVEKKGTKGKCYIEFRYLQKVEKEDTLESLLKTQDDTNNLLAEAMKDEAQMNEIIKNNPDKADEIKKFIGSTCTFESKKATITKDNIPCEVRVVKIVNTSGKLVQYAEDYYFISGEKLYTVKYTCIEGEGYNESFNFSQYLVDGFKFKPDEKK